MEKQEDQHRKGLSDKWRTLDIGLIGTAIVTIVGFAFWLGTLSQRVASLEASGIDKAKEEAVSKINEAGAHYVSSLKPTQVLVSASRLWVDAKIELKPGETIRITATGLVNLAMHRVVSAANEDKRPSLPWSPPEGIELPRDRPLYLRRQDLLVDRSAPYGALLACCVKPGETNPGKFKPTPDGVQLVGDHLVYTYPKEATGPGRLFFTINDTVLKRDERYRKAFAGTQAEIDSTYGAGKYTVADLEARWESLMDQEYWDIWFDDNTGFFLVEVVRVEPAA